MRFPILFACAAALLLISVGASHAAAPAITGEMQKKYESMQSFTAEFTQRLVHQESGSEETRQGTLAFQKPLRVRWETKAPHAELLVITDKDVWDYLPDEELAYQYSPEVVHDSRSIIQVITGQSRLDKDFTVEAEPDDNGRAPALPQRSFSAACGGAPLGGQGHEVDQEGADSGLLRQYQ